jgi:hypothetical protein
LHDETLRSPATQFKLLAMQKLDTLQKWTIGMAVVGGIAAAGGNDRHVFDVIFGALIWAGITYAVGSLVIYLKHRNKMKN